jgi:hypothetical protein
MMMMMMMMMMMIVMMMMNTSMMMVMIGDGHDDDDDAKHITPCFYGKTLRVTAAPETKITTCINSHINSDVPRARTSDIDRFTVLNVRSIYPQFSQMTDQKFVPAVIVRLNFI